MPTWQRRALDVLRRQRIVESGVLTSVAIDPIDRPRFLHYYLARQPSDRRAAIAGQESTVDSTVMRDDFAAFRVPYHRSQISAPSPTTSTPRPPASTRSSRRSGGWWSCWRSDCGQLSCRSLSMADDTLHCESADLARLTRSSDAVAGQAPSPDAGPRHATRQIGFMPRTTIEDGDLDRSIR